MSSPLDVARQFSQLTAEMGELVRQLNEADLTATRARVEYSKRYAIAWQQVSGSIEAKKQIATRTTIAYRLDAEEADCEVRRLRREIDYIGVRIDVGRSMGAAVRAEAAALGPWSEG